MINKLPLRHSLDDLRKVIRRDHRHVLTAINAGPDVNNDLGILLTFSTRETALEKLTRITTQSFVHPLSLIPDRSPTKNSECGSLIRHSFSTVTYGLLASR